MKSLDISKLEADPLLKARAKANVKTITISGYIRSINKDTFTICSSQMSKSYIECPYSAIIAAFKCDEKTTKITFLINNDTSIRIAKDCQVSELNRNKLYGCDDNDIGVAEARPWKSIHPALAELKAEIQKIKDFLGTGPGSRNLNCDTAFHNNIINGMNVDEAEFERKLCLLGIEPDKIRNILW